MKTIIKSSFAIAWGLTLAKSAAANPQEWLLFSGQAWDGCAGVIQKYIADAYSIDKQMLYFKWFDLGAREIRHNEQNQIVKGRPTFRERSVDELAIDFESAERIFRSTSDNARYPRVIDKKFQILQALTRKVELEKSPGILDAITKADAMLQPERVQLGFVQDPDAERADLIAMIPAASTFRLVSDEPGTLFGAMRVYDGTIGHYPRVSGESNHLLPIEISYSLRGMSTSKLTEFRREYSEYSIYEIGSFLLPEIEVGNAAAARLHKRVKLTLLEMLQRKVMLESGGSVFIVHVASKKHMKLYRQQYGTKLLSRNFIPATQEQVTALRRDLLQSGIALEKIESLLPFVNGSSDVDDLIQALHRKGLSSAEVAAIEKVFDSNLEFEYALWVRGQSELGPSLKSRLSAQIKTLREELGYGDHE